MAPQQRVQLQCRPGGILTGSPGPGLGEHAAVHRGVDGGLVDPVHGPRADLAAHLDVRLRRVAGQREDLHLPPHEVAVPEGQPAPHGPRRPEQEHVLRRHCWPARGGALGMSDASKPGPAPSRPSAPSIAASGAPAAPTPRPASHRKRGAGCIPGS